MKTVKRITILIIVTAFSFLSFGSVFAAETDVDGNCYNNWYINFSLELRPDYWSPGEHRYTFELTDIDSGTVEYPPITLNASETAPLYDGQVMLRFWGFDTFPRWTPLNEVNASQDTVFQVSWVAFDMNRKDAQNYWDDLELEARVKWDNGEWIELSAISLSNGCVWEDDDYLFFRHWGKPYK